MAYVCKKFYLVLLLGLIFNQYSFAQCNSPIALSNNYVNAGADIGQKIGYLSLPCAIPSDVKVAYRIAKGGIDLDLTQFFSIENSSLVTKVSFLCIRTVYSLDIEAVDVNTNNILQASRFDVFINCAPTKVIVTPTNPSADGLPHILENKPLLTEIATLSAIDYDSNPNQISYSLQNDDQGDYRFFKIIGNKLYTYHSFDYEQAPPNLDHVVNPLKKVYSVNIRAQDQGRQGISQPFQIVVDNIDGKLDANGRADADVANYYGVKQGDFLILNRFNDQSSINNILYNIENPGNQSQRIFVDAGAAIRIKGDHYGAIGFNLNNVANAQNPITITNFLGQVKCEQFKIYNGSHYRITGQYNGALNTGDVNFKGPQWQGGTTDFGYSHSKYGIIIENYDWTSVLANPDGKPSLLDIGASYDTNIVDMPCDNIEIDHIEFTGAGFAGIRAGNKYATGSMDNLYIHHNYIHDVFSEGIYLSQTDASHGGGSPFTLNNLRIENNLIVRTGSEAIQVGYAQNNCVVQNNIAWGGVAWLDPFASNQDNVIQFAAIDGNNFLQNNVILGGGEKFVILFVYPYPNYNPSGGELLVNNNLMYSNPGTHGLYLHQASNNATSYRIDNNFFGQMEFEYDRYLNIGAKEYIVGVATKSSNINLQALTIENSRPKNLKEVFIKYAGSGNIQKIDLNNSEVNILSPSFVNPIGTLNKKYKQWHLYTPLKTFLMGEVVMSPTAIGDIRFYECIDDNIGQQPSEGSPFWQMLTWPSTDSKNKHLPPDDFNLQSGTFYKNLGIGLQN